MPSFQNQDPDWCPLVSSIVEKYPKDLDFDEGMNALESLTLKVRSLNLLGVIYGFIRCDCFKLGFI